MELSRAEPAKVGECFFTSTLKIASILSPEEVNINPSCMMADFNPSINKGIINANLGAKLFNCKFHFCNLINPKLKPNALVPNRIVEGELRDKYKDLFAIKTNNRSKEFDITRIIRFDLFFFLSYHHS